MSRATRAGLGAGTVAGMLWAASGALNWYLIFVRSTVHGELVNAVIPATFGRETALGAPGAATCVVAALLVAAGVGLSAWLAARSATGGSSPSLPQRGWTPLFVGTWLGAALTSTVAALAVAIGQAAQAIPHAFIANGADWPWTSVATGAYWGALAGWVPALVAIIVARLGQTVRLEQPTQPATGDTTGTKPPPQPQRHRTWPAIGVGIVVVLALITGALSFAAESSAWAQNHAVEPGIARPSSPPPSITAVPEPTPTVTVVPLPPPEADPARCTPENALLTVGPTDAALGHRSLTIYLTNAGTTACDAFGYPSLTFTSTEGAALDIAVEPGISYMAQDPGPTKIVLAAGATAKAVLSWRSAGRLDLDGAVASIKIAPVSGGFPVPFALRLDLLDGANATLTAWQPAARKAR